MDPLACRALIERTGVIAIVRAQSADRSVDGALAVIAGGIRVVEVSMSTPGALDAVVALLRRVPDDVAVGAGTALDLQAAKAAIAAGAHFVVSPVFDPRVFVTGREAGVLTIPGCATPTEVIRAYRMGAEIIKLFPARLGGPAGVRDVLGPLPFVKLVPVGGVNEQNAADYIRMGAFAVGVGASLVDDDILAPLDTAAISTRAARLIAEVARARDFKG